jgi:putative aldouronate transport system substrate-binding protein
MKKQFFLLTAALLATVFFTAGCKGKETNESASAYLSSAGNGAVQYPLKTNEGLSFWVEPGSNLVRHYTGLNEAPYSKGKEERTGVKVDYIHPPTGGVNESLNLMFASGEMPDIITWNWMSYPGGPEKAIEDGVIIPLNEIFEKYCPNISAFLKANPDYARMIKTDDGNYYVFPLIRSDPDRMGLWHGPMMRKDWLNELGLQVPETFDEWRTILAAFKQKKNLAAPLTANFGNPIYAGVGGFAFGFGINLDFYVDDSGKVRYGSIEPECRDFLTVMAQWYKEGLLDPDFAALSSQQIAAKMTGGASGAAWGNLGGNMGTWTKTARSQNQNYELTAVRVPVPKKGEKPVILPMDYAYNGISSAAITSSCKNIELAARWLDWSWGEEGHMYENFGVLGVTYNMENGYPKYTDEILNNPQGWSVAEALAANVRSVVGGPFFQDVRYMEQYMSLPEQQAGPVIWGIDDPYRHVLPPTTPTPEESSEIARIMNEIKTYRDELMVKYILGTENLAGWNAYVETIKKMGIDRVLELQNTALARYNARELQ